MSEVIIIGKENMDLFEGGFGQALGGLYFRTFISAAGTRHEGHTHYIDHVRNFESGQALMHAKNPDTGEMKSWLILEPCRIEILKDWWHETIAITDCRWTCIFSKHEADALLEDNPTLNWTKEN